MAELHFERWLPFDVYVLLIFLAIGFHFLSANGRLLKLR